jgi:hypothetical protein
MRMRQKSFLTAESANYAQSAQSYNTIIHLDSYRGFASFAKIFAIFAVNGFRLLRHPQEIVAVKTKYS